MGKLTFEKDEVYICSQSDHVFLRRTITRVKYEKRRNHGKCYIVSYPKIILNGDSSSEAKAIGPIS